MDQRISCLQFLAFSLCEVTKISHSDIHQIKQYLNLMLTRGGVRVNQIRDDQIIDARNDEVDHDNNVELSRDQVGRYSIL